MQDKTVNLNLDQAAPPAIIHVTQGDTAWRWHFPVWLDGLRWSIPSGANAILKGTKPDGHVFAYTGSISSNEVVVDCKLQMTICAGPVGCTLIILDSAGKRLHVARIALLVAADPEAVFDVASDSALPAYAEVLNGVEELLELASTIPDDLPGYMTQAAENWLDENIDPSTGYVLDNSLTLSNAAAPADKVGEIKNDTKNITTALATLVPVALDFTPGFYITTNLSIGDRVDLTPQESSTFSYCIFDIEPGTQVRVVCTGGTKPKALSFLGDGDVLLYQATPVAGATVNGTFTAPTGAKKGVINAALNSPRTAIMGNDIAAEVDGLKSSTENIATEVDSLKSAIANIEDEVKDNLIALGKNDVGWIGNWIRPECVYFKRVREKLYFSFTSHSGAKGIAEYDFSTGLVTKRILSRIDEADLHNDLAIHINTDGTIVAAYSTGHNTDNKVRIRRSISPECLDYFSDETVLNCGGVTSYAQLVESSGKLYLFYRNTVKKWAYRVSTDSGISWGEETDLISSDAQYYCLFVKTTTDNVIRVLSYTNPGTTPLDTNIRQSFFHTDNNTLYDSDNTTVLGTVNVDKANISILIANDATLSSQRLLDAAVSPVETPYILYAPFSTYNNAVYRLRKGANTYEIAAAGAPLISAAYFLGACFIGTEKICAICGGGANGGTDFVRLYTIGESSVSLDKVIYSEIRTSLAIRNFYPITDSAKAICWLRGIYGSTYTDFNTDAKIYLIDDDKIV